MVGEAPSLKPYLRVLADASVVIMDGREMGMTLSEPDDIHIWPYHRDHQDVANLGKTYTHEIVHVVHPDMNEGAVEAKAEALMRRAAWRAEVFLHLCSLLRTEAEKLNAGQRRRKKTTSAGRSG